MTDSHQYQHDISAWIKLSLIKGLGSASLCQLLSQFGDPNAILAAKQSQLEKIIDKKLAQSIVQGADEDRVTKTLSWLETEQNHCITLADAYYPKPLLEINAPPAMLYAKGKLELLNTACIAIVGSRSATPQGEKNAEHFAENLCRQGLTIVSGMALGIDGAAHRGALKANGATIAVVGTGLDIVYPARHKTLAHQIAASGLILSEFPLGVPSMAKNFPRRNRIISGLSLGCLVVEANIDSGSLITARLAAEQGREVFAIPGSIHSPVSKGCHQLIKQGAKLVESSDDIISEIGAQITAKHDDVALHHDDITPLSDDAKTILDKMGFDPIDFETLLHATGLSASTLSTTLTLLEIEGRIHKLASGQFQQIVSQSKN